MCETIFLITVKSDILCSTRWENHPIFPVYPYTPIARQAMDSREKVKEMISQKDQIEKEIKELYDVLASVSHSVPNTLLIWTISGQTANHERDQIVIDLLQQKKQGCLTECLVLSPVPVATEV